MSPRLLPSLELIRRTLDAELSYTLSRMQVLERIPGNPIGICYRWVGNGAAALMARHLPSPSFNTVVGLGAGQEREIEPLVEWYRASGVAGRFEIVPGLCDAKLGWELARFGYYQSGFHVSTIAGPDLPVFVSCPFDVERVTDKDLMEAFLEAYVAGWGFPEKDHTQFKANVRPWLDQPGWSLYVARADGTAAAAAILNVHGGVGYLADGATKPQFRRRGLHAALIGRRIADAKCADVDFVCSGAEFLSASHRNMERAGMRIQFIRAIWTSR